MPEAEHARLHDIVETAHDAGYRTRFWATPDLAAPNRETVWRELLTPTSTTSTPTTSPGWSSSSAPTTPDPRPATRSTIVGRVARISPPFVRLVDDAAVFPPGEAPLPRAVSEHWKHRASDHAELVGSFVIGDARLPELVEVLRTEPAAAQALPTTVVVSGGAGAIQPAVTWAGRAPELSTAGLEVALRDEEDLGHNARRVVTAVDQLLVEGLLDEDTPVYVEPPRCHGDPGHGWFAALDEVAAVDHRLKFRTGGATADAFPSARELATCVGAALDRELAFKCTAGLHHALRHHDEETGFEHHGFLNVLLATRASLDGAGTDDVAAVLEMRDPAAVLAAVGEAGETGLVSARRWFRSFGSCSVHQPLEDLATLGLLR